MTTTYVGVEAVTAEIRKPGRVYVASNLGGNVPVQIVKRDLLDLIAQGFASELEAHRTPDGDLFIDRPI